MKILATQLFEVNLEEERKRLKRGLKGEQLERHLHLLSLFEQEKWKEFEKVYDALPRDEEGEFPEQELCGEYVRFVWGFLYNNGPLKNETYEDFTGVVTEHQKILKLIKEEGRMKKCEKCGYLVNIDIAHGAHKTCDYVWGRRGWRQLGVYDG